MIASHKVFFEKQAPSIEEVVNVLSVTTGLQLIYDDDIMLLSCLANDMEVIIPKHDMNYELFSLSPSFDYLLASILFVLIEFGGVYKYASTLPSYAGKKWIEVDN